MAEQALLAAALAEALLPWPGQVSEGQRGHGLLEYTPGKATLR